jgi:hypothetical protein
MYLSHRTGIMTTNPLFMKNIFSSIIAIACFITTNAQSISIDVRYRIDPKDSTIPEQQFFVSRLDSDFTYFDKKAMLELAAMRIWEKTHAGDSVVNYNPAYDLFPGFVPATTIMDCKTIPPADFAKPNGQIGGQSWAGSLNRDRFNLKAGKAVSKGLTVMPDKRIAYATDTLMREDKNGKLVSSLSYQYLQPEQFSLFFTERWNFDLTRGHMEKSVRYYGYFMKKFTYAGDFVGYAPMLCIQNPEPAFPMVKQTLIKKNVVCDVAVNRPEQMLRNDSNVQRYAGADAVNYLSIAEGNIPEGDRSKMLAAIFNFALNHPENVYPASQANVSTAVPFRSAQEIQTFFIRKDSIRVYNSTDPDVWEDGVLETKLSLGDVYAIRFYEDWYYDAKDYSMKKVVNGVGIILLKWDRWGDPVLEDAGIYIRLN